MMTKKFQVLEHPADLKIKVWGQDLAELFTNAAQAMFLAALGQKMPPTRPPKTPSEKINISVKNLEILLINFLNELIFLSDTKQKIYLKFDFSKLTQNQLIACTWGQKIPKPGFKVEIKAATFHNLEINKTKTGYQSIILFDI